MCILIVAIWIKIPTQYLVASNVLLYMPVAFKKLYVEFL